MNDDCRPRASGHTAEPAGFTPQVREHYGAALRYARRLLRSDSEAEDAVQEAFAEAYLGLAALRRPESVTAWLRSMVRHRCLRRHDLLRPEVVGQDHCELAARAREALLLCKRAEADPVLLELLAARAFAAARRRQRALAAGKPGTEPIALQRARKLRAFLSQPFGVASDVTGWPGVAVDLSDTLEGCRAILDGEVDELPASAFAYAGTLEDVHEHARSGVERVYG
jgi:DNA-directed RNA polymerase specialized sigma24 family protein